jgi:mercuric ion transport protein
MNRTSRDLSGYASGGGVIAATCAALCCAGAPIILSVLSATGLSFLRSDRILLPVIGLTLVLALWGFWMSRRRHGKSGPLTLAVIGAVVLVGGVVWLHGLIAKTAIGAGAIALLAATVWNSRETQRCDAPIPLRRASR